MRVSVNLNAQKPDTTTNAVIYARYSSHGQTEQSIEGQLAKGHEYAAAQGYTVVHEYIDRAMTGRNDNREAFQKMLSDTGKHQFQVVIVWKVDRFGRNREEIAFNKHTCKKNGVRVEYVAESLPNSPEAVILESVLEGMAEYYSIQLSQNIRRGQLESAKKCQCVGGSVPLGYTLDSDKHFVIDPQTAPVVKKIFDLYAEGATISEITGQLNEQGIRTARKQLFTKNSLTKLLKNEKYIGIYAYKDVVRVEGGVPAIVDKSTFDRVQELLKINRRAPSHTWTKVEYLLTDKLFCGHCGSPMVGESGFSHTGAKYSYYGCIKRRREKACDKKPVRQDWIEALVLDETVKLLHDDELMEYIIDRTWEYYQITDKVQEEKAVLEAQLAEVDKAINNLVRAIEAGIFNAATKSRMDELDAQKAALTASLADLELTSGIRITRDHIEYFLLRLRDLDVKDRECQKRLVQTFVNAVFVYDDGRVKITYNYSGQSSTITLNQIASAEKGKGFVCCLPCSTLTAISGRKSRHFLFFGENRTQIYYQFQLFCAIMEAKTAEGERKMKKLLAVCLTALVCWVCAGYAEETRVGDTVMFGQYEQDGNLDNGSEPIAWQVLDVQGGKALLMSRYALDCLPFHDEKTDAAWNQSALNAWLQADFHAAFTDAEWAAIAPVTLADTAADGNPEWQNTDAEPAETHVFLLSYAQVMQYLPEQEQRKVSGTEYARSRGAKFLGFTTIGIGETDWWLRSPGKESYDACFLDVRGAVGTKCVTEKLGVRPALWMDLSADRNAFPHEQQVQAKQFAEQGDYAEATALLDTLGDYAGSAALAKEYRYQQAQAEAASGNYDAAIALCTELAGYADSDALCRASRYEKAVAAQEAGDYAGAMALFADAGQYADSMARLRECCKQQGISIYYFSADAVNAGVDTGYAKQDTISGDDKHFGWRLGRFFLTGFTRVTADENQQPVFIKTLGDSVTLWFDLEQDIDALNGNAQLSLAADANGYDQQFGIPKTNFGRGTLIVRHTDYQNAKNEPAVYTDYLLAKGTTGANTRIVLHEEGDYEVALDYEVQDGELTHITSKFGNYRIFLRFSIRNGNCMVYPFDLLTGAELQNTSVAEAGFSLDLARSRYLDINVRRAVLVETANGVIEDERFNRPAKDGDRYTQEGIYTISVSNRYTGEATTKTIFVGSQALLETYVRNGFSLERLK